MEVVVEVVADKAVSTEDLDNDNHEDTNVKQPGMVHLETRLENVLATLLNNKFAAIRAFNDKQNVSRKTATIHKLQRLISSSSASSPVNDVKSDANVPNKSDHDEQVSERMREIACQKSCADEIVCQASDLVRPNYSNAQSIYQLASQNNQPRDAASSRNQLIRYEGDFVIDMEHYDGCEDDVIILSNHDKSKRHHHHHHEHRKKKRKRRKKRRQRPFQTELLPSTPELVKPINPDDLPQRARWTIMFTAFLLLFMCLLLVGITLRMAPLIDEMVRKENEELMNTLNRDPMLKQLQLRNVTA